MSLTAEDATQTVFEFTRGEGPTGAIVFDDFASLIKEALQSYPVLLDKPFRVGTARCMTAKVYLGEKSVSQTVAGPTTFDDKTYTWKTLPESIKTPIIEAMKRGGS